MNRWPGPRPSSPDRPAARWDRAEILARTDLAALADELIGGRKGHGTAARWPSPVPGHPQTGRTPPMSIFTDRSGVQRFTCWSTGTSGTAIDLLIVTRNMGAGDALALLAHRAGLHRPHTIPAPAARARPAPRTQPPEPVTDLARLRRYLTATHHQLRSAAGAEARDWISDRWGIDTASVARHGLGLDTHPRVLARSPAGAVVLPVRDQTGRAVYYQARLLSPGPDQPKYLNPPNRVATNPLIGWVRPPRPRPGPLVICEGVPDAIAAADAGYPAAALIGVAAARNPAVAATLASHLDHHGAIVALDADPAGRAAAAHLTATLTHGAAGPVGEIVTYHHSDLAAWRLATGPHWADTLAACVTNAAHRPDLATLERSGPGRARSR